MNEPIKHIINLACTEQSHATRVVRVCAFGDWTGPWGGEPEQADADQPWHRLNHWIGQDAARKPYNAITGADPEAVLYGDEREGSPSRAWRTNHPSHKEVGWQMERQNRREGRVQPDYDGLEGERLQRALEAAVDRLKAGAGGRRSEFLSALERQVAAEGPRGGSSTSPAAPEDLRPRRVTYDLRCPLCDLHVTVRAERLHRVLDTLAPHCEPVPAEVLASMAPRSNLNGMWGQMGLLEPPVGPISAFTLSLSALGARVAAR